MTLPAIKVIVADAPLVEQRRCFDLPAGAGGSVADIVARALPMLPEGEALRVRVTIGSAQSAHVVPPGLWRAVRPKAGAVICIRHVPGDPISIGLSLIGPLTGVGFSINTAFAIAGFASSTLLSAGISFAVAALAASLIPLPPKPHELPDAEDLYQLDGWQNQANPNEAIPFPVGRIRMAPLFAARPYSEIIDGEQYLYGLFVWGHGRLDISDVKIKDSDLADFGDVVINTREGTSGDAALELVREQVIEDHLTITLSPPDPELNRHTWTSPRQTDRIRLIVQMPGGLIRTKSNGKIVSHDLGFAIRQRRAGTTEWSDVFNIQLHEKTSSGFFRQYEWRVPERGIWEVEMHRISKDGGAKVTDTIVWRSAAGIRERAPIVYDGPLALSEVRIKAGALANGTLDAFNGVVQRYAPQWDGTGWVDALTRNPASSALAVLQSPAGAFPVDSGALHWDEFVDFWQHCDDKGLKYDRVLSGENSLGTALHSVLSGGRGTWRRDGQGWGVIIDRPQDVVTDTVSPINASSLHWSRNYLRRPDAFKVSFRDETDGWEQRERIIPWPGFEGTPLTFEDLALEGKTDPDEIWVEARRRQYELDLRPDTFTCIQSGAVRHATRGDAVGLSCDILDEVQVAARVRRVDGTVVVLDTSVAMEEGLLYAVKWHVYNDADTVGDVVQASVVTAPGQSPVIMLGHGAETPPVGAKIHFGLATRVSFACRLTGLEPAQDVAFRLVLQNDAPEIDTLTDAEIAPAWESISGDDVLTAGTPAAPVIAAITLEPAEYDYSGVAAASVSVPVSLPSENRVSIDRIDVSHRPAGAPGYAVTEVYGSAGVAVLNYPLGTSLDIFATAVSVFEDPGTASSARTFSVTGVFALATPLDISGITATGGLGHAQITLATAPDTAEVQLFRCASGGTLDTDTDALGDPRPVAGSSSVVMIDGDATRTDQLLGGDMADAGDWTSTDAVISGGAASNTTGTVGVISQSTSLTAGQVYRGAVVVTGLTAGSLTVRLAGGTDVEADPITADGPHLFTLTAVTGNDRFEIAWTPDCDGDVDAALLYRASATTAPQGGFDYYIAPINSDQIANTPTGPLSVMIT